MEPYEPAPPSFQLIETGGGSDFLGKPAIHFDEAAGKVLLVALDRQNALVLRRCNFDGTSCAATTLWQGPYERQLAAQGTPATPSIDVKDGHLYVLTHVGGAQAGTTRVEQVTRCALDGSDCTTFPLNDTLHGYASTLWVDPTQGRIFTLGGPRVLSCSMDGTSCVSSPFNGGAQGTNERIHPSTGRFDIEHSAPERQATCTLANPVSCSTLTPPPGDGGEGLHFVPDTKSSAWWDLDITNQGVDIHVMDETGIHRTALIQSTVASLYNNLAIEARVGTELIIRGPGAWQRCNRAATACVFGSMPVEFGPPWVAAESGRVAYAFDSTLLDCGLPGNVACSSHDIGFPDRRGGTGFDPVVARSVSGAHLFVLSLERGSRAIWHLARCDSSGAACVPWDLGATLEERFGFVTDGAIVRDPIHGRMMFSTSTTFVVCDGEGDNCSVRPEPANNGGRQLYRTIVDGVEYTSHYDDELAQTMLTTCPSPAAPCQTRIFPGHGRIYVSSVLGQILLAGPNMTTVCSSDGQTCRSLSLRNPKSLFFDEAAHTVVFASNNSVLACPVDDAADCQLWSWTADADKLDEGRVGVVADQASRTFWLMGARAGIPTVVKCSMQSPAGCAYHPLNLGRNRILDMYGTSYDAYRLMMVGRDWYNAGKPTVFFIDKP